MNLQTVVVRCALAAVVCAAAGGGAAMGNIVVTQWNFQNLAVATNNAPAPSTGVGSALPLGMANTLNGVTSVNGADIFGGNSANGSTDPLQGGTPTIARGWRVRGVGVAGGPSANGWSTLAPEFSQGAQFNVPTTGFAGITVSYDLYVTDRGPAHWQLQYTLDGSSWTSAGPVGFANLLGDRWYNSNLVSLSGVSGADNNPNFGIRVVTLFAPGTSTYLAADGGAPTNTSGNWRFDMVTVTAAIPTPGAAAMLGLGGVLAMRRRRVK
ncbi:MAG: hypothetical protein MUE97_06745 [Phycisphaerales bacterium]|nr:hypothetical protein [Phycisphaerales bacterium]